MISTAARAARRRFARRVSLGLMVLTAILATCAITFHRMHAIALEESREILTLETQRRAGQAATWLEARADSFQRFAKAVSQDEALDPMATGALLDRLRHRDDAFTDLALMDETGRALSGSTSGSGIHGSFPWLRDASAAKEFSGGMYPGPDGGIRIFLSRRLTSEGRGMHLRAEADTQGLSQAVTENDENAAWFLLDGHGAAFPLGGPPAPGAALTALALYKHSNGTPMAQSSDSGRITAVSPLPGIPIPTPNGPGLAVSIHEPQTPYKNLGLALTILAAACLAYSGYVRARALKP